MSHFVVRQGDVRRRENGDATGPVDACRALEECRRALACLDLEGTDIEIVDKDFILASSNPEHVRRLYPTRGSSQAPQSSVRQCTGPQLREVFEQRGGPVGLVAGWSCVVDDGQPHVTYVVQRFFDRGGEVFADFLQLASVETWVVAAQYVQDSAGPVCREGLEVDFAAGGEQGEAPSRVIETTPPFSDKNVLPPGSKLSLRKLTVKPHAGPASREN